VFGDCRRVRKQLVLVHCSGLQQGLECLSSDLAGLEESLGVEGGIATEE
jgi:hypothetical protein